jgi:hypothetical protein
MQAESPENPQGNGHAKVGSLLETSNFLGNRRKKVGAALVRDGPTHGVWMINDPVGKKAAMRGGE